MITLRFKSGRTLFVYVTSTITLVPNERKTMTRCFSKVSWGVFGPRKGLTVVQDYVVLSQQLMLLRCILCVLIYGSVGVCVCVCVCIRSLIAHSWHSFAGYLFRSDDLPP